jgi:uncharacterized coiled-coil DUF342 family protein
MKQVQRDLGKTADDLDGALRLLYANPLKQVAVDREAQIEKVQAEIADLQDQLATLQKKLKKLQATERKDL